MGSIASQKNPSLMRKLCSPTLIDPVIGQPVVAEDLELEGAQGFFKELLKVLLGWGLGLSCVELFLGQHIVVEHHTDSVVADGKHSNRMTIISIDEPIFRSRDSEGGEMARRSQGGLEHRRQDDTKITIMLCARCIDTWVSDSYSQVHKRTRDKRTMHT